MSNSNAPKNTTKRLFSKGMFGYSTSEVDEFLEGVTREVSQLQAEIASLKMERDGAKAEATAMAERMADAESALREARARLLEELPADGGGSADDILRAAKKAADEMISEARVRAETIVSDAEERVASIYREMRERSAAIKADYEKTLGEYEQFVGKIRRLSLSLQREAEDRIEPYLG